MADRVAIVTGASRGIGRGIALALGELGWSVAVNYAANAAAAKEVVHLIAAAGGKARAIRADIGVAANRTRLVDATLQHFGHIDLLVNNAGAPPTVRTDIVDATEESFDHVIAINLKGPYFLTQRVAQEMIRTIKKRKEKRLQHPPPPLPPSSPSPPSPPTPSPPIAGTTASPKPVSP